MQEELHNSQNVNLQTIQEEVRIYFGLFFVLISYNYLMIMKKTILLLLIIILSSCNAYTDSSIYLNNIIFVDPGHGGKDNGTHYNDIFEDELNLKLAKIIFEDIMEDGGICYLSRVNDYDLSSMYAKNHKIEDLNKRIKYIQDSKATLFVSLHLNYYSSEKVNGLQVFYQKNNDESEKLANIMQSVLNKENKKDKSCKIGDFYILNNCKIPGILIEFGFLSNEYDRNRLLDDSYLHELSSLILKAINEYLLTIKKY